MAALRAALLMMESGIWFFTKRFGPEEDDDFLVKETGLGF